MQPLLPVHSDCAAYQLCTQLRPELHTDASILEVACLLQGGAHSAVIGACNKGAAAAGPQVQQRRQKVQHLWMQPIQPHIISATIATDAKEQLVIGAL